ncbi:MAG: nodulation protein NfeD [Myxococcales bacterium]|nr:nodulation protein NfeD [Myxococcales bacterium]
MTLHRPHRAFAVLPALLLLLAAAFAAPAPAQAANLNVATIAGSINPASADHLMKVIARSEQEGAAAVLIELDTPGGLLAATKDIIQSILNAKVPVIVYVSPRGAWAASAGTFITMAGHVAAMAPGTSIGAAHPVGIGGGNKGPAEDEEGNAQRDFAAEKAENFTASFIESIANERGRNAEWAVEAVRRSVAISQDEALEKNVIDLVADSRADLLAKIEGREVTVNGVKRTLELEGATVVEVPMSRMNQFLDVLASPDLAVLLMLAGMLGIYVEFTNPGLIVPGVIGAVCLVLGFVALQILPFSWLGLFLLAGGLSLFVAEIFFTSYGLLFTAGVACFLLGGSMLFDMPEVNDLNVSFFRVLLPSVAGMSAFVGLVIVAVTRSMRLPEITGQGELVGMSGKAQTELSPEGMIFVRGEMWKARAEEPVAIGERVEVIGVDGLELRVRKVDPRR